jgi:hypothetical protein
MDMEALVHGRARSPVFPEAENPLTSGCEGAAAAAYGLGLAQKAQGPRTHLVHQRAASNRPDEKKGIPSLRHRVGQPMPKPAHNPSSRRGTPPGPDPPQFLRQVGSTTNPGPTG